MDLIALFMHWDAGRSKSELALSLGMDRKTVQKYLAPAEAEGLVPRSRARCRGVAGPGLGLVPDGRGRQTATDYLAGV